jgi:hypothetical protein
VVLVRREGLAKAQAMLDLIQALRREVQTRLAARNPLSHAANPAKKSV